MMIAGNGNGGEKGETRVAELKEGGDPGQMVKNSMDKKPKTAQERGKTAAKLASGPPLGRLAGKLFPAGV